MRLPALSYAVESVLGAAVVVLSVVVFYPDPPVRPAATRPVETTPPVGHARPVAPHGNTRGDTRTFAAAEAERVRLAAEWAARLKESGEALTDDPRRRAAVWDAHLKALRAELVGTFDAGPNRDAPWADLARSVLDMRAQMLASELLLGAAPDPLLRQENGARSRAVVAGCDDALVRFWKVQDDNSRGSVRAEEFRAAVERVYDSPYPPARRLPAVLAWLWASRRLGPDHPLREDLAEWEGRFWELFDAAVRLRPLVIDEGLVDTAARWQAYRQAHGGSRADALAELDRHIRRAGGRDYLRRTVRGEGLMQLAWDARGGGFADTVPEGAWEVFRGHLGEAREVLLDAADADPDGYSAPTRLLPVCMGLGAPRAEFDDAFRRAMRANPDNRTACHARLEYLHPKWHGSRDGADYVAACWAMALCPGDGWVQSGMLLNVFANHPVIGAAFEADRGAAARYYQSGEVFGAVWTACRAIEAARPAETEATQILARVAVVAGRTEVAREAFGRGGPHYVPGVFLNHAEFLRFREEAGVTP